MLMVIFGAGASYDSSADFAPPKPELFSGPTFSERWRPPLATQLFLDPNEVFGDIVQRYRKLLPIIHRLRRPPSGSVEQELEFFQEEAKGDLERTRQLFSVRYYLHDLLRKITIEWLRRTNHVTNYGVLLDQVRHLNAGAEPVCLVTFNYDLLLDDALLSFGYKKTQDLENNFYTHPVFKLFKPHGSIDWARLVDFSISPTTRMGPEQLVEQADNIKLTENYVFANATESGEIFKFEKPIVPAIAVPVQTKTEDTFEWPKSHRAYLESLLPQVTKILIVGWQAKEAHFLQMLRDALPMRGRGVTHLMVVGRDRQDALATLKYFAGELSISPYKYAAADNGFSQFAGSSEAELFLKA